MKRWLCILLLGLVAFASCSREERVEPLSPSEQSGYKHNPPFPEGEKVTIEFDLPGFGPATKSLDEGGVLNTLHLAVFGGSGYLKEYVQAEPVRTDDYTYETTDKEGNVVSRTVPCYRFSVTLALSDSRRVIHFIGNGPTVLPFGYDTAVMPIQLTANGDMGYWQMREFPDGIKAKRNEDGDFVDGSGNVIPEGGKGYVADDATERQFQGIAMIRNWAKMVLSADEDSYFTPISFAAVNVPVRGSMAPYSASTGFIEDYHERSFLWLEETAQYPGNLPIGTSFNSTIPDASSFYGPVFAQGVADANDENGAVYMYERPAPSASVSPSYVIIYGHYRNPDDLEHEGDYFYKVDLMETKKIEGTNEWNSRYYPIYRNFKYQIVVKKILSMGFATPLAASTSAGSADVSADINTGHLSDISDGVGRLHITSWMSKTFTRQQTDEVSDLQVYFSVDGEADMVARNVKVTLLPAEDGGSDIIEGLKIYPPSTESWNYGWRQIGFTTVAPGRTVRTQKIRVTGTHDVGRLYRDITVTIQPIQQMKVTCNQPRIDAEKGVEEDITISIPDGLVESMFPLKFIIEAQNMTLTPNTEISNNNLPVVYGPSISGDDDYPGTGGKQAFQFERTLSWSEYLTLKRVEDENEQTWRSLVAYFKTNCQDNASRVWVSNEFFYKASDAFINFRYKYFRNFSFTDPIPQARDVTIPVTFQMVKDDDGDYPKDYPEVLIVPNGLRLDYDDVPGLRSGDVPGTYVYKPQSQTVTLPFISTTSQAEEFSVDLYANEYEHGHIQTCKFPMLKFLDGHPLSSGQKWANNSWSNVVWGYVNNDNNKNVILAYRDDPAKLNTPITLELTNLNKFTNSVTFPITPSGPRSETSDFNYHEIELKTIKNNADVRVVVNSPGYLVEEISAGRFAGNIRTMRVSGSNAFKAANTYGFTLDNPKFTYSEDNGKVTVSFSEVSAINGDVVLDAGGTYTMTIKSENSDQTLFYVDFWFRKENNGTIYLPKSMLPAQGEIARYPGDDRQYVWAIPRGNGTASVTFTAPDDSNIRIQEMYIKAFNGYLMENGVQIP